ncbi:MotE family protein [Metabacillus herbersteinensis]|uniref:MotE family protein n=1 Tax=Metabacillus herbersteinensis TaxID=283816 RepID=A0ABV6GCZ4_9BACI
MEKTERDYGKFQWFFFVIFIPVLFTLILVSVILTMAGFDPLGKTKDFASTLPFIDKLVEEEKVNSDTNVQKVSEKLQQEQTGLKKTLANQNADISALENDVSLKESEIGRLNQEVKSLEEQIKLLEESNKESSSKDIAKIYGEMSSKKAAEIIPILDTDDAMMILTSIKDDQLTAVLEKMTAEDAAKYTKLLAEQIE